MLYAFFLTIQLLGGVAFGIDLIDAYQRHTRDRWAKLYAPKLNGLLEFEEHSPELMLARLHGYPNRGDSRTVLFQGSFLESIDNEKLLEGVLQEYLVKFGPARSFTVKTFVKENDSPLYQVLNKFGYEVDENCPVMAIESIDELLKSNLPLADGYRILRVANRKDLHRFSSLHEGSSPYLLSKMPDNIFSDPHFNFWVIETMDGQVACTALLEHHDGISGIHLVKTHPDHRRKGLARNLVQLAILDAFERFPEIEAVVLGSTPEGVPLYKSMGFREIAVYDSFEYVASGSARRPKPHNLMFK